MQRLASLQPDDALVTALGSLRIACVVPGDLLVLPFASVLTEKILNSACFGLRSPLHLLHRDHIGSIDAWKLCFKL